MLPWSQRIDDLVKNAMKMDIHGKELVEYFKGGAHDIAVEFQQGEKSMFNELNRRYQVYTQ